MTDAAARQRHGDPANDDLHRYDTAFRQLVESPELSGLAGTDEQEQLHGYVRRIAGSCFCGAGISPSVIRFATSRAADRWDLPVDDVDAMVGSRLLHTTASLINSVH